MPIVVRDKTYTRPAPSVRVGTNQVIRQMNQAVEQVSDAITNIKTIVTTHTRAALVAELTAMGEKPAELLAQFNRMKAFVEDSDATRDEGTLP